jgi:hypothetical protein
VPFLPEARNEKAPARFLSGRTSAMFEGCVKGGRFVKEFFTIVYNHMREIRVISGPQRAVTRLTAAGRGSACTKRTRQLAQISSSGSCGARSGRMMIAVCVHHGRKPQYTMASSSRVGYKRNMEVTPWHAAN